MHPFQQYLLFSWILMCSVCCFCFWKIEVYEKKAHKEEEDWIRKNYDPNIFKRKNEENDT